MRALFVLLLVLVFAAPAHADWSELGGQIGGRAYDPQLADVGGVPWLTATNLPVNGMSATTTQEWTGATWADHGALTSGNATGPQIADVGGTPYGVSIVTTSADHADVRVARWTGLAWVAVGGTLNTGVASQVAIAAVGGVPYVAYKDQPFGLGRDTIHVKAFSGGSWTDVGGVVNDGSGSNAIGFAFGAVGGLATVGYLEQDTGGSRTAVKQYTGGSWTKLGPDFDVAAVSSITGVADLGGKPVIAFQGVAGSGDNGIGASRWTGSAWVQYGTTLPVPALPSLAIVDGAPWLASDGGTAQDAFVRVRRWTGTAWEQVGSPLRHNAFYTALAPSLAVVAGVPRVAWYENDDNAYAMYVAGYDGAAPPPPPDPPAAPHLTSLYPAPSADENNPRIRGTAVAGTTIRLYGDAACTGPVLATDSESLLEGAGITFHVADDTTTTVYATATNADGTSACSSGLTYVEDSSPAVRTLSFAAGAVTVREDVGAVSVTVNRTGDPGPATAYAVIQPGTASADDFGGATHALAFGQGETAKTFTVPITDDGLHEHDESFTLHLTGPSARTAVGPDATVTITDDDPVDTAILSGPDGATGDATPAFTFAADPPDADHFACAIDDGTPASCGSPFTTAALPDGPHTFSVAAAIGAVVDPSPATRRFLVDTTGPIATIELTGNRAGAFYDTRVTARVGGSDAGSGFDTARCVVDPPGVPAGYDALPAGDCQLADVRGIGEHVVYAAARDKVGNVGAVVSSGRFTIVETPDTTISGGPAQGSTTWRRDASFTLGSNVPGADFECSFDGARYAACPDVFSSTLSIGSHTLRAVAVANGLRDQSPAQRSFTVAPTETHADRCTVQPFVGPVPGARTTLGCGWGPTCPDRVDCGPVVATCPEAAVCTITLGTTFDSDTDRFTDQPRLKPGGGVQFRNFFGEWSVGTQIGFETTRAGCSLSVWNVIGSGTALHPNGDPDGRRHCAAERTVSYFGQGKPVGTYCAALALDSTGKPFQPDPGDYAPDGTRRLACSVRLGISAATALEAAAAGEKLQLYAPQPGYFSVPGTLPPVQRARAAAAAAGAKRPVAAFKTVRIKVKRAGPVTVRPVFTRAARRLLQRTGRVSVRVAATFTGTGGKRQKRTSTVTLTAPPAAPKAAITAGLRRVCRRGTPAVRRTPACRKAAK